MHVYMLFWKQKQKLKIVKKKLHLISFFRCEHRGWCGKTITWLIIKIWWFVFQSTIANTYHFLFQICIYSIIVAFLFTIWYFLFVVYIRRMYTDCLCPPCFLWIGLIGLTCLLYSSLEILTFFIILNLITVSWFMIDITCFHFLFWEIIIFSLTFQNH